MRDCIGDNARDMASGAARLSTRNTLPDGRSALRTSRQNASNRVSGTWDSQKPKKMKS